MPKLPSELTSAIKDYPKAKDRLIDAHEEFLSKVDDLSTAYSDYAETFNHGEATADDEAEKEENESIADSWMDFMNSFVELDFDDEPALPEVKA